MPTRLTHKLRLALAILLIAVPTLVACATGIGRIDQYERHAGELRLVGDELPELMERPITVAATLCLPNRSPLADAAQVFEGYRSIRAFGLSYEPLADSVVYVLSGRFESFETIYQSVPFLVAKVQVASGQQVSLLLLDDEVWGNLATKLHYPTATGKHPLIARAPLFAPIHLFPRVAPTRHLPFQPVNEFAVSVGNGNYHTVYRVSSSPVIPVKPERAFPVNDAGQITLLGFAEVRDSGIACSKAVSILKHSRCAAQVLRLAQTEFVRLLADTANWPVGQELPQSGVWRDFVVLLKECYFAVRPESSSSHVYNELVSIALTTASLTVFLVGAPPTHKCVGFRACANHQPSFS